MSLLIHNPILPGFYPDPSILRVGGDYYIASSSFEWFPGVPIHHSRDLVHWRLIGHALTDAKALDMKGVPDSGGIWAPSLSFDQGVYFLCYTNVRTRSGPFKDVPNFLVTATDILGPWSPPIFLNSSGFDPSLFHDDDGRKWLVNILWNFRKNRQRFGGIVLQEYDHAQKKLIGPIHPILHKPGVSEGPNLYKVNGIYYLMTADGGTSWNHHVAMARSKTITGPYEVDPQARVLTSYKNPALELQKAGHGELVETAGGEWYLAHLCSRPVYPDRRCILGRETALQKVEWSRDGWLRLVGGGTDPQVIVPAPQGVVEQTWPAEPTRDDFDQTVLGLHWSSLRAPVSEDWLSLGERPGWLRLVGRESLTSFFEQSLVARRLRNLHCAAETCLEFASNDYTQMAGLIIYYSTSAFYYLCVRHEPGTGKVLTIQAMDDNIFDEAVAGMMAVEEWSRIYLRAEIDEAALRFAASPDGVDWKMVGPTLDLSKLSDDYGHTNNSHFTGTFAGICAQDLGGARQHADFDYFELKARDESA